MKEKYFYVFVRQDLPMAQQIIQTNHAVYEVAGRYKRFRIFGKRMPNEVLIGVPNEEALQQVLQYLDIHGISHSKFIDTDFDFGMAAVATPPVPDEKRKLLRHFPLWKS